MSARQPAGGARRRQRRHHRLSLVLLLLLVGVVALPAGALTASAAPDASTAPACVRPEVPHSRGYDAATKHDRAFNQRFRHCFLTVDGVQMHYVIGGTGPQTTVLLHGWPESWYEFHGVLPELLPGRTVIAIDLPGMGDSTGQVPSFTKTTLARYVHGLLDQIGRQRDVRVVAHDFGVGVAYALAAQYREQVAGLFLMDFPLVGKALSFAQVQPLSWHFSFNVQNPLAEDLVTGREKTFLTYFFEHSQIGDAAAATATSAQPVPASSIAEYTRVYSRPQVLHAGFELYRTWAQDEAENTRLQAAPLTIPVRLLTQDGFSGLMLPAVRAAAPLATGAEVAGASHWMVEEHPERVIAEINAFYPTR
ncbi:alpha/beta fold hydrolase [Goodfellowiella coeruleoviolacea]|uniref:Pimeloyl-ACP methyl ester carboxylesterase n=1 Tax=Goodfellowiella coeruleoviolacea TaxID=334858 RepID=A0AAE3KGC8_9PSEU|nr:alpha/beta hydrolase [Goodfellowiella coeruleoviolacea]MCP2166025.1 Pimeloyl-ACP methyl ester carboxylesterase [Goodfellowiella coeruleoviolacea]